MKLFNLHTHQVINNGIFNAGLTLHNDHCSCGLHPWNIKDDWEEQLSFLQKLVYSDHVVAVGETGLDKLSEVDWELQLTVFRKHLEIVNEVNKPMIIHCVKAYNELLRELSGNHQTVVFHDFNKGKGVLSQLLRQQNFFVSIGKAIIRDHFREVIREMPINRLFIETDDTDLNLDSLYHHVAAIKNVTLQQLVDQIDKNKRQVFGI